MKRMVFFLTLIALMGFSKDLMANIGPAFDVQMLYKEAPIICKVTVQEVKATLLPVAHEKRLFKGSVATLKVHRYYKGEGSGVIKIKYPSGEIVASSRLTVNGWGFRNLEEGQDLIVFIKKEVESYRFFYDVYDSYIPISNNTNSSVEGFQAIREAIVNSIDDEWPVAGASIEQVNSHGWIEALPKLREVKKNYHNSKYIKSVLARISLGDRSALEESFEFFSESHKFENECYLLSKDKQEDCYSLQNAQSACLSLYAELGTTKGQLLIKAVAEGELPWLNSNVVSSAEGKLNSLVTPQQVLELGDNAFFDSSADCIIDDISTDPGLKVVNAIPRKDWYYSIRYDFDSRAKVCSEVKAWWFKEGRNVFVDEVE